MTAGAIPGVVRKHAGNRNYYFGTVKSDQLKSITFVPVIENSPKTPLIENTDNGYQRPGTQSRMSKFKDFLSDFPDAIVPPILLSSRGKWNFNPYDEANPNYGEITIEGSAAIIDGQHRCGGYVLHYESTNESKNVDFILIEVPELKDEMTEFVTVNNTQMGVPKSLSGFLGIEIGDIPAIRGLEAEDTWVGWQLNLREDSPIKGKITRTRLQKNQLFTLAAVSKNITRMFKNGAFDDLGREEKLDIAIKYWNLINENHPLQWQDLEILNSGGNRKDFRWKMLETTGFIAWSMIANTSLLPNAYNSSSCTMDWDQVENKIRILSEKIDWEKNGEYEGLTGEVGGPRISKDMERVLSLHN